LAAAIVFAALGSTKPHPVFPFCLAAAAAEHTPTVGLPAQQAELQSASLTHPPVINCWASPAPTFFAPALLGVTVANAVNATAIVSTAKWREHEDSQAKVARIEMRTILTVVEELVNEYELKKKDS
jgi:hypothetical protein